MNYVPMKLIYVANIRLPTEKAHGYQIGKMCEAFAELGLTVELLVPTRRNYLTTEDPFSFYGLKRDFKIFRINCIDFLDLIGGLVGYWLQSLFFLFKLIFYKVDKEDFVYTRNPEIAWLFSLKSNKVVYEAHTWPVSKAILYKYLLRQVKYIITITKGIKDLFQKNDFNQARILNAPDGVDLKQFGLSIDRREARGRLNLPMDKKIIVYTGHLYGWKGADVLAEAATKMSNDVLVYLVGGTNKDISIFKKKYTAPNLNIVGFRPHIEIPLWLKAADILVLPNKSGEKISESYTSPLKLFEYMASRRPIIASDLPALREILNEKNSLLVTSGDPRVLADGIKQVLEDEKFGLKLSEAAYMDAQEYSWNKRAQKILHFISGANNEQKHAYFL